MSAPRSRRRRFNLRNQQLATRAIADMDNNIDDGINEQLGGYVARAQPLNQVPDNELTTEQEDVITRVDAVGTELEEAEPDLEQFIEGFDTLLKLAEL